MQYLNNRTFWFAVALFSMSFIIASNWSIIGLQVPQFPSDTCAYMFFNSRHLINTYSYWTSVNSQVVLSVILNSSKYNTERDRYCICRFSISTNFLGISTTLRSVLIQISSREIYVWNHFPGWYRVLNQISYFIGSCLSGISCSQRFQIKIHTQLTSLLYAAFRLLEKDSKLMKYQICIRFYIEIAKTNMK